MKNRRNIRTMAVSVAAVVAVWLAAVPACPEDLSGEHASEPAVEEPAEVVPAAKKQRNWRMRLMAAVVEGGGFTVTSGGSNGAFVGTRGGGGVGINFEYRYSPKMGFEMGALALASNIGVTGGKHHHYWGAVDLESYVPLTFGLNYHPLKRTDRFDLYVGPLLTTTFYSNIGIGTRYGGSGVESGVKIGLGANLGADLNLGRSRWSLSGGLKYIALSGGGVSDLELDPLIVTFGVGFAF
jgi:outer membrane protein W